MQHKIDGLLIHKVPLGKISISGHSLENTGLSNSPYVQSLKQSIITVGIIQPLVLYKVANMLHIADGGHRYLCALETKLPVVPAVIFDSLDECHPTENLQW